MPRRATSVSEIDQILRVYGLLNSIGVCPAPLLEVITANGQAHVGQLLKNLTGSMPRTRGYYCYGAITLTSEAGKTEIDYLDVVTIDKYAPKTARRSSRTAQAPRWKPAHAPRRKPLGRTT